MPLITTHSYFAQDVLKKTSQKIKTNLENKQNIYILFARLLQLKFKEYKIELGTT